MSFHLQIYITVGQKVMVTKCKNIWRWSSGRSELSRYHPLIIIFIPSNYFMQSLQTLLVQSYSPKDFKKWEADLLMGPRTKSFDRSPLQLLL